MPPPGSNRLDPAWPCSHRWRADHLHLRRRPANCCLPVQASLGAKKNSRLPGRISTGDLRVCGAVFFLSYREPAEVPGAGIEPAEPGL